MMLVKLSYYYLLLVEQEIQQWVMQVQMQMMNQRRARGAYREVHWEDDGLDRW